MIRNCHLDILTVIIEESDTVASTCGTGLEFANLSFYLPGLWPMVRPAGHGQFGKMGPNSLHNTIAVAQTVLAIVSCNSVEKRRMEIGKGLILTILTQIINIVTNFAFPLI